MSAPQELEIKQARRSPPNPSPPLEDDLSEAGNIFQRSDDEVEDQGNNAAAAEDGNNNSHIIPKSPDEFWKRSVSMRGGRGGPAPRFYNHPNKYSPPLSIGMPSWGSMEDHGLEDTQEGGMNVITPAVKGQMQHPSIHPNMFCYPPSSPIKASPPSGGSPVEEFEGGDEFLPPQPSTRRAPNADTIKTPRDMDEPPIHFPSDREPSIKPQFVRETKVSKTTPPRRHPSLVVDASTSHDSAETPGRSLQGGRVQVVGGDAGGNAWSLVSHSRSIESGEDSWSAPDHGSVPSPTKRYGPPPMYHPYIGGPPISHSSSMPPGYPPRYGMPPGPPPGYDREGWSPYPPRYEYGRYPYLLPMEHLIPHLVSLRKMKRTKMPILCLRIIILTTIRSYVLNSKIPRRGARGRQVLLPVIWLLAVKLRHVNVVVVIRRKNWHQPQQWPPLPLPRQLVKNKKRSRWRLEMK